MDRSDASPSHHPKVDDLTADITQLMDEAGQMLGDSTSHHAEPQVALLRSQLPPDRESVGACFNAFCSNASRAISDQARRTDRAIRENPYQALMLVLGAGLLWGLVKGRRA